MNTGIEELVATNNRLSFQLANTELLHQAAVNQINRLVVERNQLRVELGKVENAIRGCLESCRGRKD